MVDSTKEIIKNTAGILLATSRDFAVLAPVAKLINKLVEISDKVQTAKEVDLLRSQLAETLESDLDEFKCEVLRTLLNFAPKVLSPTSVSVLDPKQLDDDFVSAKYLANNAALERIQLGADKGDPLAQAYLSNLFNRGYQLLPCDSARAVHEADKCKQWLRTTASSGNMYALFNLALWTADSHGSGIPHLKEAFRLYKLAADQGHAGAQRVIGMCFEDGTQVEVNLKEAVRYYNLAADQGHPDAQNSLGLCWERGKGVSVDSAKALKYYKLAAEQGYALALYHVGACLFNGTGVCVDNVEAVKYFKLAADQGSADAQFQLGRCYCDGRGVSVDYTAAVKYYQLAADQGHAGAQCNLGTCFEKGVGVSTDVALAVKYYQQAAGQGDAYAQHNLGDCYYNGTGVSVDNAMASKYYKLAADQGSSAALCRVGVYYSVHHAGLLQNYVDAVRCFELAADMGDNNAQCLLGTCYENGTGVAVDVKEAMQYYRLAAKNGSSSAQYLLNELVNRVGKKAGVHFEEKE